jgi:hypothetical protein
MLKLCVKVSWFEEAISTSFMKIGDEKKSLLVRDEFNQFHEDRGREKGIFGEEKEPKSKITGTQTSFSTKIVLLYFCLIFPPTLQQQNNHVRAPHRFSH